MKKRRALFTEDVRHRRESKCSSRADFERSISANIDALMIR